MNLLKALGLARAAREAKNAEKAIRKATTALGLHGVLEEIVKGAATHELKAAAAKLPAGVKVILQESVK